MRSFLAVLLLLLSLPVPAVAAEVRLSAAASLTDAVDELVTAFEKRTGDDVFANFAASGILARQIAQGAPVDIYIAANPCWMQYLVDLGKISDGSVRPFATNSLVFIGRKGSEVAALSDIVRLERIALGSPQSVPAGRYAAQALEAAGLYPQVREKLVIAKDVRQALVYADRGAADGAFVYRTDARLARHAVILFEVPTRLHDEVIYPVALAAGGNKNPAARIFYEFLATAEARAILEKQGFGLRAAVNEGESP